MSHVQHIINNKPYLEMRAEIIRLIREFFWSKRFLEVETPLILGLPGQEPYLSPMKVIVHNEKKHAFQGYLHTSPEYTLKKMLAAGFTNIFSVCKTFRDYESFGGTHNPEFTMIEWYRANEDFYSLMDDVEELFQFVTKHLSSVIARSAKQATWQSHDEHIEDEIATLTRHGGGFARNDSFTEWERLHMRDAWQRYAGVNLDDYLETEAMFKLCQKKGYAPNTNEPYEDLFYRIFLNEIEPHLGKEHPTILHHYPIPMAALSRISDKDPRYAERMEVYVGGLELGNGFSELTDPEEQLTRLKKEQEERKKAGKDVFDIDMEFIDALKTMPASAGIALGIDRMVQLFTGCKNIDAVLSLPASKLFATSDT